MRYTVVMAHDLPEGEDPSSVVVVEADSPTIAAAMAAGGSECPVVEGVTVPPSDVLVFRDELTEEEGGHGRYTVVLCYTKDGPPRLWYEWTEAANQVLAAAKVSGGYPGIPSGAHVFQGRGADVDRSRGGAS